MNEIRGRVANDGNGRVGGEYRFADYLCYHYINVYDFLPEQAADWFAEEFEEVVKVQAIIRVGYDHSVGCNYYSEILEELPIDPQIQERIYLCPVQFDKAAAYNRFVEIVEGLGAEDYETDD